MIRRTRLPSPSLESLEPRRLLSVAPVLAPIPQADVPVGKTLQVPLTTDYDGAVTYAIRSSSRTIQATLHPAADPFVQIDVAGYADPMVFELFRDVAPEAVRRFTGLVNSGYYNGLTFHRVINHFAIQSGDPTGTGNGRPDATFDDEFNPTAIFSGTGQLAMANGGKDDNGSQFFITEGPQRLLDFNHTIFGQLVRGEDTRQEISEVPVDDKDRPLESVTISSAKVIADTTDAVLQIKSLSGVGGSVRVTALTDDGYSIQSFDVQPYTDTINDPPILGPLPAVYYTPVDTPLVATLHAADSEGDAVTWGGLRIVSDGLAAANISATGRLRVVPNPGFVGQIKLLVGVGAVGAHSRGSTDYDATQPLGAIFDTQAITIAVGDAPLSAVAYDLDAVSGSTAAGLQVASFRDGDTSKTAADFTAKVDWGDGNVTDGRVVSGSRAGTYLVFASKAFAGAAAGAVPLTVTINDGQGATATADATITVRDFAGLADGLLTVWGTSGPDRIGVSRKGIYYAVSVDGTTQAIPADDVLAIRVYGLAARDRIALTDDVIAPAYLDGGVGNDLIYGGGGPEVINAGAGNDFVQCGDGSTRVAGGDGNDTIFGGAGRDRIYGGDGNDFLSGGSGRDLLGGDGGDDTLIGGASNDTLYGGDGNDILNGLGGHDLVFGGAGFDIAKRDDDDAFSRDVEKLVD